MENWKTYKLGELGRVVTGKTPPTKDIDNYGGKYPFICIPDLGNSVYVKETSKTISDKGLLTVRNCLLPKNSIVISCIATIGKIGITDKPSITNQQINSIVPDEKIVDPIFLYYRLRNFQQVLESFGGGGSVFNIISKSKFEGIPVKIPDLPEQKAIVKFLSSLDEKIELNQRMNETLEAIARALFKAWFVDFEPVRANAENRPSESASPAIAKLFPSEFENGIPKGWRIGAVGDLGKIICGKTPSTKVVDNFGFDIPFITIPDMHGKVFVTKTARQLSNKGANTQLNKYLPANSICISCIATAGLVALTSETSQTNQQINSVIPNNDFGAYYCFQVLDELGQEIRTKGGGGSVFVNLNTGSFSKINVLLPTTECSKIYDDVVRPTFEKILSNEKEHQQLAQIRDSLLPRLISGKIRVGELDGCYNAASRGALR